MDYHVFAVSRIREARDLGMTTAQAISAGVRSTAGVVTSAAVIMVAVFAVFGSLSMQDFKHLGVGLAVAIALDATVIRVLVLLPSVMALLGDRNWYVPRWLAWMPRHRRPMRRVTSPGEPGRGTWSAARPNCCTRARSKWVGGLTSRGLVGGADQREPLPLWMAWDRSKARSWPPWIS